MTERPSTAAGRALLKELPEKRAENMARLRRQLEKAGLL